MSFGHAGKNEVKSPLSDNPHHSNNDQVTITVIVR